MKVIEVMESFRPSDDDVHRELMVVDRLKRRQHRVRINMTLVMDFMARTGTEKAQTIARVWEQAYHCSFMEAEDQFFEEHQEMVIEYALHMQQHVEDMDADQADVQADIPDILLSEDPAEFFAYPDDRKTFFPFTALLSQREKAALQYVSNKTRHSMNRLAVQGLRNELDIHLKRLTGRTLKDSSMGEMAA